MNFKFLGTAAAEGFPALFCQCDTCKRAAEAGGKNIRGRSSALIGEHILIDFPADMLTYKMRYGLDLAEVSHIFFTHSHIDHLAANELCYYHHWYSNRRNPDSKIIIYGNTNVLETIRNAFRFDSGQVDCLTLREISPFQKIAVGAISLTPLLATHDRRETCVFYLIEHGDSRMLFANDTANFPEETYSFLRDVKLNVVSLDCTTGRFSSGKTHMGFAENLQVKQRLLEQGSADVETMFISHHFSHNGGVTYDEFASLAAGSGFRSSWDGMEIQLGSDLPQC